MDYDKKYNDALDWMRKIYPTLTGANKEDAEHYFPELKESEDERIRKEIIEYLTITREKDLVARPERQRWITYLEKQKDQDVKVISWREPDDCADIPEGHYVVIAYKPGVFGLGYIGNGKVVCAPGQKPSGILYIPNADESIIVESKEHKPAEWSEEDKKALNRAINICRNDFGEYSETAKFLKSLPKRFNLQPQQQWSEEDERIKDNLLSELFNLYVGAQIKESTYFKYKDWVKTIPRPISLTKEQKCAIRRATVIAENNGEDHLARVLNSVYNETNLAS